MSWENAGLWRSFEKWLRKVGFTEVVLELVDENTPATQIQRGSSCGIVGAMALSWLHHGRDPGEVPDFMTHDVHSAVDIRHIYQANELLHQSRGTTVFLQEQSVDILMVSHNNDQPVTLWDFHAPISRQKGEQYARVCGFDLLVLTIARSVFSVAVENKPLIGPGSFLRIISYQTIRKEGSIGFPLSTK